MKVNIMILTAMLCDLFLNASFAAFEVKINNKLKIDVNIRYKVFKSKGPDNICISRPYTFQIRKNEFHIIQRNCTDCYLIFNMDDAEHIIINNNSSS